MNQAAASRRNAESKNLWRRIITFFKEVLAEFKKVQRPTRKELWQLFLTVVFFVAVVMIFVGVIDVIFNQGMFWIFG
ncbi:preprotein translocase subunit SecE [Trueperella pyogenes]|uniref:Protein translocase subunit SecE n=1 Tax=Trueperella pyogenes TaxID=1661 RepID=A0A3Q9GJW4_9ACTO|nr:preprotein translocase subunit SecE [Trueperella pyogenes]AWG04165.1 preprotein translocase subunit SecE [Trueperella pyogenes]AWG16892.1 preprotein translocase subunit SecE [Trueperella pyogenes]AZR03884.1 preprotein translocase subunit SecE [Trueperella pyogenes]AZR06609.1 preprotein translocase subunit SecE [Trueperella pyogenes]MCI7690406.1 preprotein translocase subunit SecE [Trueperella pyogenes]